MLSIRIASFSVMLFTAQAATGQARVDSSRCDGVFALADVQQEPQFLGGMPSLYEYLTKNLRYPDEAVAADIQGKVYVGFVVARSGEVKDVVIAKGVHALLDSEAVRVVSSMPLWTPGMKECGAVDCRYTLPVSFKVQTLEPTALPPTVDTIPGTDDIYDLATVAVQPEFKGGMGRMYQWMSDHLRYPVFAYENNIQGKVIVQFTVQKTGELADIAIKQGVHATLDAEALRMMHTMPPWTPGYLNGQAVRTRFNMPVVFNMR